MFVEWKSPHYPYNIIQFLQLCISNPRNYSNWAKVPSIWDQLRKFCDRGQCSHPGRCPRWSRRMRWAWRWCPLWGPPRPGSWWTCWTPSAAASRSWPHHICIVHYILTPSYLMAWSTIPLPTAVTLDSSSSARPSTSRWGWAEDSLGMFAIYLFFA